MDRVGWQALRIGSRRSRDKERASAYYHSMRNSDAPEYFESFLIAAIAAILLIRGFLHVTGYPTVGGDSLHIAHMLWGGVLMMAALVLLLGRLGKPAKSAAAVIGGAGWGTFIDELGKFLTHDNDYFYEPTFALIYISFVILYLVFERQRRRQLTREEAVGNALELTLEAVRRDMDSEEQRRALALLEACDPADPLVRSIRRAIATVELAPPGRRGLMWRARHTARALYRWLIRRRWFAPAVIAFFVIHSANSLIQAMLVVQQAVPTLLLLIGGLLLATLLLHPANPARVTRFSDAAAVLVAGTALIAGAAAGHRALPELSFVQWAELVSSVVPAFFVLLGIVRMRRSRLEAYRAFRMAVLVLIFVTQFFTFYQRQLMAIVGLVVNITIWLTLRSMIQQEERLRGRTASGAT